MSAVFRLGHQYNGAPCEVDNCPHSVENSSLKRCYEHNPQRLIEALFTPSEQCQFGGVTCEGQASRATEDEVVMCQACYNVYQWQLHRANREIEYNIAVEQYVATLRRRNEEMRK